MKKIHLLLIPSVISLLFLTNCSKVDLLSTAPSCVKEKVNEFLKSDCPSVQSVYQYSFQGQIVYVIHPKKCGADLTSSIIDEKCVTICSIGGITGNQLCNGETFSKSAVNEKLIWGSN